MPDRGSSAVAACGVYAPKSTVNAMMYSHTHRNKATPQMTRGVADRQVWMRGVFGNSSESQIPGGKQSLLHETDECSELRKLRKDPHSIKVAPYRHVKYGNARERFPRIDVALYRQRGTSSINATQRSPMNENISD